jgi:hypothetical protein
VRLTKKREGLFTARKSKPHQKREKFVEQYRYSDLLSQLSAGLFHGVFIDDTGSPGGSIAGQHLHPERKTWVAVICPPHDMAEIMRQMPGSLEELQRTTGATEFHFTDIYNRKGAFKKVHPSLRVALFEFMADIFLVYNFPIIVQTFDPVSTKELRARAVFPTQVGPFNLAKQEDLALFFLLVRVKNYFEQHAHGRGPWARVFVDEGDGFKKNGAAIRMSTFTSCFADGLVCFAKSESVFPIQLADFAAFALNRTQLIRAKAKMADFDHTLLEILSPIAWNYLNIPKVTLDEVELARKMNHE